MDDTTASVSGYSSSDDGDISDKELQLAFEKGLIQPGLNAVKTKVVRVGINNTAALRLKLAEFSKKSLGWSERLDVTSERGIEESTNQDEREDDFQRELSFCKQCQASVIEGISELHKMCIATRRPNDYFAEMAKSDQHMIKVRKNLLDLQRLRERQVAARKLREEKKFASKVQKETTLQRLKQKKKLADVIKKHRKGLSSDLDAVLNEKPATGSKKAKLGDKLTKKAAYKKKTFGFGGQKKRGKYNTAESASSFEQFRREKHSMPRKGVRGNKKLQRPGKNRRQKTRSRKTV